MTWLADKLKHRIRILKPTQTGNDSGGFDRGYETLATIWSGLVPLAAGEYVRGEQIDAIVTHEFEIRRSSVSTLGIAYATGFSDSFDAIRDLNPLKNTYFIFLKKGTYKGRLFQIQNVKDENERGETLLIQATEVEEQGTGWPE